MPSKLNKVLFESREKFHPNTMQSQPLTALLAANKEVFAMAAWALHCEHESVQDIVCFGSHRQANGASMDKSTIMNDCA